MNSFSENSFFEQLHLVEPREVLDSLGAWIRVERQRLDFTQTELARRSGVPATTISRLERTGLASTDSLMRILFALDRIDAFQEFLKERRRLAAFPLTLHEIRPERVVKRVRHSGKKERQ